MCFFYDPSALVEHWAYTNFEATGFDHDRVSKVNEKYSVQSQLTVFRYISQRENQLPLFCNVQILFVAICFDVDEVFCLGDIKHQHGSGVRNLICTLLIEIYIPRRDRAMGNDAAKVPNELNGLPVCCITIWNLRKDQCNK